MQRLSVFRIFHVTTQTRFLAKRAAAWNNPAQRKAICKETDRVATPRAIADSQN
jgi:hypothetical protein